MAFTPHNVEQSLKGIGLQEKEEEKNSRNNSKTKDVLQVKGKHSADKGLKIHYNAWNYKKKKKTEEKHVGKLMRIIPNTKED